MRIVWGMVALALVAPAAAQDAEPPKKPAEIVAEARQALEGVEGIRGVSYAGIEGKYRLFVTLDRDESFLDVCNALGGEFRGMRVVISRPSKPKADAPAKVESPVDPPPPPASSKPKEEPVATEPDPGDVARLDALAKKIYEIGVETIRMYELLECDGIRAALKLPQRETGKGEKRCEYIVQLKWGFRASANGGDIVKHRKECAFDSELITRILPQEIKNDLATYAELFKKIAKAKKK